MAGFVMLSIAQKNKKEMYIAVQNILKNAQAILATVAACLAAYTKFAANIIKISDTASDRDQGRSGATDLKHEAKETALNLIYILRGKIFNFAVDNNHPELEAVAKITRSKLGKLSYVLLFDKGMEFHAIATRFVLEMTEYGITQEYLDNFLLQMNEYNGTIGKAKGGQTQAKTDTQLLKDLFAENDLILEKMDNYMDDFEKENPVLVANYRNARVIYDLGGSHSTESSEAPAEMKSDAVSKSPAEG